MLYDPAANNYLPLHAHLLAMSFPATGMESAYRNNLKDVAKMLKTKHEENYMVCMYIGTS